MPVPFSVYISVFGLDSLNLSFVSNADIRKTDRLLGGSAAEPRLVKIPVADYVAAANATIPTDEEWTECLTAAGYDSEQIAVILSGGNM